MGQVNINPSTPSGPSESGFGMGSWSGLRSSSSSSSCSSFSPAHESSTPTQTKGPCSMRPR